MKTVAIIFLVSIFIPSGHGQQKHAEIPNPSVEVKTPGKDITTAAHDAAEKENKRDVSKGVKKYLKRAFGAEFLAAWFLVVAAGIGLYATFRTLATIREQTGAIANSARAATAEVELVVNKERALLRVTVKRLDLIPKNEAGVSTVDFSVYNHGATVALISGSGIAAGFLPTANVSDPDIWDRITFPIPLLPKEIVPASPVESFSVLELLKNCDLATEMRSGGITPVLRGFIRYKDVFGKEHRTSFRYYWRVDDVIASVLNTTIPYGEWVPCGPAEDNEET